MAEPHVASTAANPAKGSRPESIVEELNLLIDGAVDYAIYMLDPNGLITIWNKGAERLLGWSGDEVIGRHCELFYPADARDAGKPAADLEKASRLGKYQKEDWRQRRDGSEFLANVSITALYDEHRSLRGYGRVVRDVTDQRAAERQLAANEAHLRSILATVPDAMVVVDEEGLILSFSAAAERLFGFSEAEMIGRNVAALMPAPDRDRHDSYLERYLNSGDKRIIGQSRETSGMRRDGTIFPVELSIGEAVADGRRVFTGFVRDLTERVRTQDRLEELRSELIHVARVSAMGTMASTLAHELNQPITAVANYAVAMSDLFKSGREADPAMVKDALDDMVSEALRAGDIVRRLREFVARGEVEKRVEDLPSLIREAASLGLVGARERGVEVRFELDPDATPVLVDKVQIQQVLINLMRNAIEAMANSPERRLNIATSCEDNELVRVTVADSGPGVSHEIAAQLFRAFVSSKSTGMGLGLSICRTIVEANGGAIHMDQREGGGTEFHFTLTRTLMEKPDE